MRALSGDDFGRAAPPAVWRAETGFCHDPDTSAADVIRFEQEAHGRPLGLGAALLAALDEYPASALLWVTATRDDALRYAPAENVAQLRLDIPAFVIATDDHGGLLLFFPDDITQPTGGAAMADRFENDPAAELRAAITTEIDHEATPSPSYTFTNSESAATVSGLSAAAAVDLAAHNQGWRIVFSPVHLEAGGFAGPFAPSELGRIQLYSDDNAFVAGGATYEELAAAISGKGVPLSLDPPPTPSLDDDEEQKRRAGRGGGDMGNPAHATLSANIRPDVGSGPAGLETYTTQKSADYNADPEQNISDYFRERMAEAERRADPPTLTLEAIADDPWNAVELPLPANADKELLTAARSAAEYSMVGEHELMTLAREGDYTPPGWTGAEGEPDVHEYNEGRYLRAEARYGAINEALDKIDERGPDPAAQQEIDASTKRQNAELSARNGETPSSDVEASISDYFASRKSEAKAERESDGAELAELDHGTDKTPGGGGGRGIF